MPSTLNCSFGVGGEDNYLNVMINSSEVEFGMHETHISAKRAKSVTSGNSLSILDQKLSGSVEGDTFTAQVNALLVYDPSTKVLNVTLLLDGHPQIASQDLACE